MSDYYLGRIYDTQSGETTQEPLLYDGDDLTTHGVIVGMTGSGKTGLCLDLMEEAALNGIPALMIDPKGDITNALLHFPELLPADFEPWIDPAAAQRDGKTTAEAAEQTAALWRNGLAKWEIGPDRIRRLKESAAFSIYTPGSTSGRQISILSSLAAPVIGWSGNEEELRERIGSTVTALLGLIGRNNIDPVRDREHILLSNIFEHAWRQGNDLTLADLIMQTQNPPFEKLGVFDVGVFFNDRDRFDLALQLNNIMAAPAFQAWIEGEPLDIERLLWHADGTPRHTIFYIAHLNDAERMFFVTLLYSSVATWMRTQSGSGSLRALIYFDEIFGYLPPVSNPPSKRPMLRLLKQARAFGVGLVLATQNPVDIDYKALSNAGTWFIGKLGTDQDKQRLLDGLESAIGGGLERADYDRLISSLGKRVFLLRNVHEGQPQTFQTRWAMNYLAGPITRMRIGELNRLAGADEAAPVAASTMAAARPAAQPKEAAKPQLALPGTSTHPQPPGRIEEFFLPLNVSFNEALRNSRAAADEQLAVLYRPVLLTQAALRVQKARYDVDVDQIRAFLIPEPDRRGRVRWEEYEREQPFNRRDFDSRPAGDARFVNLEDPLNQSRVLTAIKRDFVDWCYRNSEVVIAVNEALDVYGQPDESDEAFKRRCEEAAEERMNEEVEKLEQRFESKGDALKTKLRREERELEEDRAELSARKREEGVKHLETLTSLLGFGRKRSLSSSMSKRRMTSKAKADVEESEEEIEALKKEIEALGEEHEDAVEALREKWQAVAEEREEMRLQPYKKDVVVDLFGVAWQPYYLVGDERGFEELDAYAAQR